MRSMIRRDAGGLSRDGKPCRSGSRRGFREFGLTERVDIALPFAVGALRGALRCDDD